MSDQTLIVVNRYTDFTKLMTFTDANGDPEDMTGWTLTIVDATELASFTPEIAWVDQAGGVAQFSVPWNDQLPANFQLYSRIHMRRGEEDVGTPLIYLAYK